MRIGLLVTSIGNFGQKGFYNAQEVGLAKALDKIVDEVIVYKLVSLNQRNKIEKIEGCVNSEIHFIPAKSFGINGTFHVRILDTTLDALVYFSDTQFAVPKVYRWAKKNNIRFLPYIGVLESHSLNRLKKYIVDFMFKRNLAVYQKSLCIAKTPAVDAELRKLEVNDIVVAPVGLDISLLKADFNNYSSADLKKKYGYQENDKVLLFIGRLIAEKQPVRMIEILSDLIKQDKNYKLLMVGTGELKELVEERIRTLDLEKTVQMVERIPNRDIWELYRFADAFVNLNQQEIFGMAILEAMYYCCKVVAWKAPGPNLITEDGVSGWLADSNREVIDGIMDGTEVGSAAHRRVLANFAWESTAYKLKAIIGD